MLPLAFIPFLFHFPLLWHRQFLCNALAFEPDTLAGVLPAPKLLSAKSTAQKVPLRRKALDF